MDKCTSRLMLITGTNSRKMCRLNIRDPAIGYKYVFKANLGEAERQYLRV